MIKELKGKANSYVNVGILSVIMFYGVQELKYTMPEILKILGMILIMVGCMYYALSKGYSKLTGLFIGLFGMLGWLAIYFMHDKTKEENIDIGLSKNI